MSGWNTNYVDHHVFVAPGDLVIHNIKLFPLYLSGDVVNTIYYVVVKFLVIFLGFFITATDYISALPLMINLYHSE